jgi:hypothetical protein
MGGLEELLTGNLGGIHILDNLRAIDIVAEQVVHDLDTLGTAEGLTVALGGGSSWGLDRLGGGHGLRSGLLLRGRGLNMILQHNLIVNRRLRSRAFGS